MELKRTISAPLLVALSDPYFFPVMFVWLDWPGGVIRASSSTASITWGGNTYLGVGKFGSVSVPEESSSGVPTDFSLSIVCDLPELATYADAVVRRREGTIWLGATTTRGGNVLRGNPMELVSGTMDTMVLSTEVESTEDQVVVAYTLSVGMTTGPGMRTMASMQHSHEDQVRQYPTDTAGMRLVLATARAEKTLWPEP